MNRIIIEHAYVGCIINLHESHDFQGTSTSKFVAKAWTFKALTGFPLVTVRNQLPQEIKRQLTYRGIASDVIVLVTDNLLTLQTSSVL